jgi:hypothetical protein
MSNWSEFFTDVETNLPASDDANESSNGLMYDTTSDEGNSFDDANDSEIDNSIAENGDEDGIEDGVEENYDDPYDDYEDEETEETTTDEVIETVEDSETDAEDKDTTYPAFKPIFHKIVDEDGEMTDVELSEEDIAKAAFDKKNGTVDMLFKVIDQAKPVIDVYSKNATAKWFVDGLAKGYSEDELLAALIQQRSGTLSQTNIAKQQEEEREYLENLTPIERELYDMKKRLASFEAEKEQMAQQQQKQYETQRQQQVLQEIARHNETLIVDIQKELGYELTAQDVPYLQEALAKFYTKDVDNPKAGFYNFAERKFNKNQIRGIIKYGLTSKQEQEAKNAPAKKPVDTKKAEQIKATARQQQAPKVLSGGVGVGKNQKAVSPSSLEQKMQKQGYLSASERAKYFQELF